MRSSKDELTKFYNVQSIAGPSVITQVDSDEEADPYLETGWCTDNEHTPEEIKQHEKVQRKRVEREKNTPPPPVRATGSMGRIKYFKGVAKQPAPKPVKTINRYDGLAETDWTKLPLFQIKDQDKKPERPKVDPKNYISLKTIQGRRIPRPLKLV